MYVSRQAVRAPANLIAVIARLRARPRRAVTCATSEARGDLTFPDLRSAPPSFFVSSVVSMLGDSSRRNSVALYENDCISDRVGVFHHCVVFELRGACGVHACSRSSCRVSA